MCVVIVHLFLKHLQWNYHCSWITDLRESGVPFKGRAYTCICIQKTWYITNDISCLLKWWRNTYSELRWFFASTEKLVWNNPALKRVKMIGLSLGMQQKLNDKKKSYIFWFIEVSTKKDKKLLQQCTMHIDTVFHHSFG